MPERSSAEIQHGKSGIVFSVDPLKREGCTGAGDGRIVLGQRPAAEIEPRQVKRTIIGCGMGNGPGGAAGNGGSEGGGMGDGGMGMGGIRSGVGDGVSVFMLVCSKDPFFVPPRHQSVR